MYTSVQYIAPLYLNHEVIQYMNMKRVNFLYTKSSNFICTWQDENGEFFYIDRWSSVYTWGGEPVPSTGQLVVVDNGQTLLLDQSTDVLKMLLIKGE